GARCAARWLGTWESRRSRSRRNSRAAADECHTPRCCPERNAAMLPAAHETAVDQDYSRESPLHRDLTWWWEACRLSHMQALGYADDQLVPPAREGHPPELWSGSDEQMFRLARKLRPAPALATGHGTRSETVTTSQGTTPAPAPLDGPAAETPPAEAT